MTYDEYLEAILSMVKKVESINVLRKIYTFIKYVVN